MPDREEIPSGDAVWRSIYFPRMYWDAHALIWNGIFDFASGQAESLIWSKYAPTPNEIHEIGCVRERIKRLVKPEFQYLGAVSGLVQQIRGIRVNGHGFSVDHEPGEAIHHAEVKYAPAEGVDLKRTDKNDLKFQLRQVFGPQQPHTCAA